MGHIGHNSGREYSLDHSAAEQLRSFIERIERLEEEKAAVGSDIKDVFAEAKGTGLDVKIMKEVIKLRKQEPHAREEQNTLLVLYASALGMAVSGLGHNQGPPMDDAVAEQLRSFIERVERLEEEKAAIGSHIKDVFAEAKGSGFDTKIMKKTIRLRKMDPQKREEEEQLLELYRSAVGV